uniref:Ovule protein n=1 Tax=Angiostrongylus cantonensis TaxID=6313 RepID=A0A0K0DGY2_ANGCA
MLYAACMERRVKLGRRSKEKKVVDLYLPVSSTEPISMMSYNLGDDNLSEQYVNLVDTKRGKETNRDELIQSLAGKLREFKDVNVKRKQRRSSKHRKSSKESRIEEDVSSRRTDDGSSTRERDESSRRRKEDAGMRKYDDEESSDFETAVRTADRRRRREGMWDSSTRDRR